MMTFKEFLQETMTSTGCIAGFPRIIMPPVTRKWPSDITGLAKKKHKIYKLPQVEENKLR